MKLEYNVDLSRRNTFRMKVKASCLVEYDSAKELSDFFSDERLAAQLPLPFFHIGGGSNLLFTGDFPGTILHSGIKFIEKKDERTIRVGAGVVWDEFCAWCSSEELWGAENLSLIPGETGAAAVQNIGAYGREIKDIIKEVECFDIVRLSKVILKKEDCAYAYRDSIFKNEFKGRYIVTAVVFSLKDEYAPELDYGNVRAAAVSAFGLDAVENERLKLKDIRDLIIDIRRKKLPDPLETGNAGSFFRNPFVSPGKYSEVHKLAIAENLGEVPHFISDAGLVKIPAAWLIEKCGWKGYKGENAGVYEKQPLVLINATGKARPDDILELENKIKESVYERFGIRLEAEVEHV